MSDTLSLTRMDRRLSAIILSGETGSARGALFTILKIVNKTSRDRREAIWQHFERASNRSIRDHVRRLHAVCNEVASEQAEKDEAFDEWHQRVRAASGKAETIEGEPA